MRLTKGPPKDAPSNLEILIREAAGTREVNVHAQINQHTKG